jgi:hypothetical protein
VPLPLRKAHALDRRHQTPQEIRGSGVKRSAVNLVLNRHFHLVQSAGLEHKLAASRLKPGRCARCERPTSTEYEYPLIECVGSITANSPR